MSNKKDLSFLVSKDLIENPIQLDEGVFKSISNAILKLLGRDGQVEIERISAAVNQAQEGIIVAATIAKKIETGTVKLKTNTDVDNFKIVATQSGLYGSDGNRKARSQQDVAKHIDIIIAKNKTFQIKDRSIKDFMTGFLNSVQSDDFCGGFG
jgi:hypothetical protein